MRLTTFLLSGVLVMTAGMTGLAGSAGCGMIGDTDSSEAAVTESDGLFGDDRVADALKDKLENIPKDYAAAEKLFGVGRACARKDSKEIFVVEEAQTRM